MTRLRLLTLPIKISLRIVALELRIARDVAGAALDITRDLAGGSPLDRETAVAATTPVPRPTAPDPAEPAGRARGGAPVQRPRAQRRPPAATTATDVPPAPEEA